MHAICARLRMISHIIRCPGYIQSVPAGENYLGSFCEISPQMLPCILRKHLRTVSHKASLAPARRRGDGHRRFPAAKGGLGREGGTAPAAGCWAPKLQVVGVKASSSWPFLGRGLCSAGCVVGRVDTAVVLAPFKWWTKEGERRWLEFLQEA